MRIQHQLGADIIFAFDELTTLMNTRELPGTVGAAYARLGRALPGRARPADRRSGRTGRTRRCSGWSRARSTRTCAGRPAGTWPRSRSTGSGFDGYGIGGALEKENLGTIVGWCAEELPEDRPRHLLGISEPDDIFTAIEHGADTFDCVSPSRVARNAAVYTRDGRFNVNTAASRARVRARSTPSATATPARTTPGPTCTTCSRPRRCWPSTLCTIHNERFIVSLVDRIRASIETGDFDGVPGRVPRPLLRRESDPAVSAAARCAGPGRPRAWPASRPAARTP